MRKEPGFKDRRILDAFDYIDKRFVAEAAHKIKDRPIGNTVSDAKTSKRVIVNQVLKLVACLLILSMTIPVLTYVVRNYTDFGSLFGDHTTETAPELTTPETPPAETTAEVTTEAETTAEETTEAETTAEETTAEETTSPPEAVYDGSRGLEYLSVGNQATLYGIGSCTDTDIVVASTYNGVPVTRIGVGAFANRSDIVSVTIPDTVHTVSTGAFSGCTGLKTLVIGSGMTTLPSDIFSGCPNLESIEISPENGYYSSAGNCLINKKTKTLIGAFASSVIPADGSVEIIGAGAFSDAEWLTELIVPEGVKTLKAGAVANCPELKSISLPASLSDFEAGAIVGCPRLSSISAAEGETYVAKGNCLINVSLKRLVLGCAASVIPDDKSIVYIGESAFEGSGIRTLDIPDSVTTIEASAFKNCTSLESIRLSENLSAIGESAFRGCTKLAGIEFPMHLDEIGKSAFEGCSALKSLDLSIYIVRIYDRAFKDCISIESVKLNRPQSWSNNRVAVYASAFEGCTSLRKLELSGYIELWGGSVFKNCVNLKSFSAPNLNYEIYESMFAGCTSLESVSLPDNVSIIGNSVFAGCTSLKSFTAGEEMRKVGAGAFSGCRSLEEFIYLGTADEWHGVTKNTGWRNGALFTVVKCSDKEIGVNEGQNHNGAPGLVHVMNEDGKSATLTSLGKWWYLYGGKLANTYNGVPVTHIARDVFSGKAISIEKITLPDYLAEVCDEQFMYNYRLSEITIPATVTKIGADAFRGCIALESVTFKGTRDQWNKLELGENWNLGCNFNTVVCLNGTVTVEVPEEVNDGTPGLLYGVSAEGYAFFAGMDQSCTETDIRIATQYKGYKVTAVCDSACYSNTRVTSVILPEGIERIGEAAFYRCSSLKKVVLPKSLRIIDDCAFIDCPELQSIDLPEGLITIGESAFNGCVLLSEIDIPESLENLGGNSFYGCDLITSIYIPKNVTDLGGGIYLANLKNVTVHKDNPVYRVYGKCLINKETKTVIQVWGQTDFPNDGSIEIIGEGAIWGRDDVTELIFPEGVKHLFYSSVGRLDNLKKLHIPSTLTEIEYPIESSFGLTGLEEITVAAGNPKYYAKDNCLIDKDTGTLILVNKYGKMPTDGSIKSIGYGAFARFGELKSIVIPEGVVSLEQSVFSGCTALESVSLPESLESIGSRAFSGCTSLKKISIGDNVKSFGVEVFAGCTSLEEVTLPKQVEYWAWSIFESCKNLKRIVVPYGATYVDFRKCTSLTDIVLPETVTQADFYGCTSLRTAILPESMTKMYDMFYGCTALEEVVLPAGLTTVYSRAFYGCTSLKNVVIEGDVTEIGANAFSRCVSLESITLPASVTSIKSEAFRGCTSLREIVFEGSMAEWAKISKGANWDTETVLAVIRCSDGTVTADAQPEDYSDIEKLPEAFRAVLRGEATFRYAGKGEDILLDDIDTFWESGKLSEMDQVDYAVVDMDGDGKLEVVISTYNHNSYSSNFGDKIILREENGVVYGYHFAGSSVRGSDYMESIKADGSFIWRLDASRYYCYSTISFSGENYTLTTHCKYRSSGADAEYYVGNKKVTREEFNEYTKRFEKDQVIWYDLDRYPLETSSQN